MADKHLVFVPRHTGYELAEREGDPPGPGAEVALDGDATYVVVKVSPSPLPEDDRLCAYLQPR
jgi:hypothetical protein